MCNTRRRSLIQSNEFNDTTLPVLNLTPQLAQSSMKSKTAFGLVEAMKTQEKHCVQHDYHDHAQDNNETIKVDRPMVSKGGVTVPFPLKLHDMLENIEVLEPELAHVISWQPHGRCFLVHKPKLFADLVLSRFFQQKKYASFQRQLNLYGFNRITKGPDRGSYYHELFLRGKKFLCRDINRMKIKGTGARMASNPEAEPIFYQMPQLSATTDATPATITEDHNTNNDIKSSLSSAVQVMPPLKVTSQLAYPMPGSQEELDELDFVFGNMPFHSINQLQESRRHSLMAIQQRRNTLVKELSKRNSKVASQSSLSNLSNTPAIQAVQSQPDDEVVFNEMDVISSRGNSAITDRDMVDILYKIIH
jgi:hypothetical protein